MKKLTKQQIMILHGILVKHSGGSDGIRDTGLLESALEAPFITFHAEKYGNEKNPHGFTKPFKATAE